MIPQIHLRRGKEESLLRRHPWIFSGAIESVRYDGNEIPEGALVDVYTRSGDFIARGHYQIGSIAVRVLTFEQEPIDAAWWQRMISTALDVRRTLGLTDAPDTTCYRLVHGEGDSLPGLVVDIYDTTAVIQCHSVGMYHARLTIADAIRTVYGDRITAIYDKSSQTVPFKAGLNPVDGYLYGKTEECPAPCSKTAKNSWSTGKRARRRASLSTSASTATGTPLRPRTHGLNTFCYTGGFSVYALAGGAREVCSIDSSERAVALADANVRLNFGEEAPHTSLAVDAVEYLKDIGDRYDMIILDPPAFAKHHKVLGNAMQGYKRLNARALAQIKSGGLLFTFSCSQAVSKELFRTTVFSAAAIAGRKVRILHQLTQPADHPINIYHPEGEYLKGLVLTSNKSALEPNPNSRYGTRNDRPGISRQTQNPVRHLSPPGFPDHRRGQGILARGRVETLQKPLLPQPQGRPSLFGLFRLRPLAGDSRSGTPTAAGQTHLRLAAAHGTLPGARTGVPCRRSALSTTRNTTYISF